MNKIIECDPNVLSGAPRIKGRRLSVFNVVSRIFFENNLKVAIRDMEISKEEALQAVVYCKELECQRDNTLKKFCAGCVLRTINEGNGVLNSEGILEIKTDDGGKIVIDENNVFLGSKQEYEDHRFGRIGWGLADDVYYKYW